jgi:hypothetical protein
MSPSADKKEKEPTLQDKITGSLKTTVLMAIYILMGVGLCYLKIVLGDMCRDETLTHSKFTESTGSVVGRATTPTVPYYNRDNQTEYVKQVFNKNPNFIIDYANTAYDKSGKDQMMKMFFLETSYVIFGIVNLLEDIPNWLIVLLGPYILPFALIGLAFFTWIMLSYNLFLYFMNPVTFFSSWGLGWIAAFFYWFIFMVLFGYVTVMVSMVYGLFRFIMLAAKTDIRRLNVPLSNSGVPPANAADSEPYGFGRYALDMLKTSGGVQLLTVYTIYSIMAKFSSIVGLVFIGVVVLMLIYYGGSISLVNPEKLETSGWTDYVDSIKLPTKTSGTSSLMNALSSAASTAHGYLNKGLNMLNSTDTAAKAKEYLKEKATKYMGDENAEKAKKYLNKGVDILTNKDSAEKAKQDLKNYAAKHITKGLESLKSNAEPTVASATTQNPN